MMTLRMQRLAVELRYHVRADRPVGGRDAAATAGTAYYIGYYARSSSTEMDSHP